MLAFRSVHDAESYYSRKKAFHERQNLAGTVDDRLAKRASTDYAFHYDDMPSRLVCESDGTAMEVFAGGPSNVAAVLRRAVERLAEPDSTFQPPVDDWNYGLHLRFTRTDDNVLMERVREVGHELLAGDVPPEGRPPTDLDGPPRLTVSFDEFVQAVDDYEQWHLTEHIAEAPWLLGVPLIQQWRRDAGYPPDRL